MHSYAFQFWIPPQILVGLTSQNWIKYTRQFTRMAKKPEKDLTEKL